jgi:hypothetical protein
VESDDQVAIAAFASDSTSTGAMSLLPTQPVTIYPLENPGSPPTAAPGSRRSMPWRRSKVAYRGCMPQ